MVMDHFMRLAVRSGAIDMSAPAGPAPLGKTPNLSSEDPASAFIQVAAALVLFTSVCFVALRLYTQHFAFEGLVVEDYIIFVGLCVNSANLIIGLVILDRGIGKHMWNISNHDFYHGFQLTWLYANLYILVMAMIRTAILLQIIRIFAPRGVNKTTRHICFALITINIIFYSCMFFLQVFECIPVSRAWHPNKVGHCLKVGNVYMAGAVYNMLSDIIILTIPIPCILKLNMQNKRKIYVIAVFATGILAFFAAVVRAYFTFSAYKTNDLSYYLYWMGFSCALETTFGFMICFAPIASVFTSHVKNRFWPAVTSSSTLDTLPTPTKAIERAVSKQYISPYDLPSLASFEERNRVQTISTIEYLPTPPGDVKHSVSSHTSKSGSPENNILVTTEYGFRADASDNDASQEELVKRR